MAHDIGSGRAAAATFAGSEMLIAKAAAISAANTSTTLPNPASGPG